MDIKNGKDLKEFLNTLTEEELKLPLYFDTEGRTFNYHMALIARVYCEGDDVMGKDMGQIYFIESDYK